MDPDDGRVSGKGKYWSLDESFVAEGDFFEAAEAFFSGDLKWTLAALHRHFFSGGDARPVIAALQNRNRILLQVRALVDAGAVQADLGDAYVAALPRDLVR